MIPALLALGSNIEPRRYFLRQAVHYLQRIGVVRAVAPLYESRPYGVTEQARFLNSAVVLDCRYGDALMLLDAIKDIEGRLGRRHRQRWGPREIDIDIIFFGGQISDSDRLTVPHADYHHRRFVLQPLCDIAPQFKSPAGGETIREMLRRCEDNGPLTLLQTEWTYDHRQF